MFEGRRILVAGLGKSGIAAFDALVRSGALPAVCDDRDIEADQPDLFRRLRALGAETYLNGSLVPDEAWDFVVPSPGVPLWLPYIEKARERGAKIIGELELSYLLGRGRYAAITGTNGKTTTTTLVGEIFRGAGLKTVVAGNIGTAVAGEAMDSDDDTWLVTEVSSFQLETTETFCPKIAALLNLTPDHMDRHKTMENYGAAKAKIFANQGAEDFLIYNADDAEVRTLVKTCRARKIPFSRVKILDGGVFVKDGAIVFADGSGAEPLPITGIDRVGIPGAHNLENALAATGVAVAAGIDTAVIAAALESFAGVEHRLEFVLEMGGVFFVNDSKGTNPDAAIKAIEAIGENIVLIAGGYDKGADFAEYIRAAKGRVKKLILLGATAERIRDRALAEGFAASDLHMAAGMDEAVRLGAAFAAPGDTVLLSPACASWDMYRDYEERGDIFRESARRVKAERGEER